jgi:hypothetical protein
MKKVPPPMNKSPTLLMLVASAFVCQAMSVTSKVEREILTTVKSLNVMVTMMKAYKAWVKKPDTEAYMAVRDKTEKFAKEDPECDMNVPR